MEYVHNPAAQACNWRNSQKAVFIKCQPLVSPTHKHQLFTVSFCTSSCLNHSFTQRVCSSLWLPILFSVSALNASRFYLWLENGATLFPAHDVTEAAFKRDFMVFIYRKKKPVFFPLQINSSLLLSMEVNKKKT